MKNRKALLISSFAVGSTWFGTHAGSGFATGSQGLIYYVRFGASVIVANLLAVTIMGIFAYSVWDFCRIYKTYDYRSFYNKLYAPYDNIFATAFELIYLTQMTMAMGGVFAGGGELISNILGVPFLVGAVIITFVVFITTVYGVDLLVKAASFLSTLLIIVLTIITLAGIMAKWDVIKSILVFGYSEVTWGAALLSAVTYASFQCTLVGATTSITQGITSNKEAKLSAVFGFLFNGVMMIMISVMMLGYTPDILDQVLPVFYVITDLNIPFLRVAYSAMLLLAFITTGITLVFSIISRFEKYGSKLIPELGTRRKVFTFIYILICYAVSLAGLPAIVQKGYGAVGYIAIPLVMIPTIVVSYIKRKKVLEKDIVTE